MRMSVMVRPLGRASEALFGVEFPQRLTSGDYRAVRADPSPCGQVCAADGQWLVTHWSLYGL